MSQGGTLMSDVNKKFMLAGGLMAVLAVICGFLGMTMSTGDDKALQHGYLFGWVYWACVAFGCLGITLLHHACRGSWGFPVLRIFEAGSTPATLGVFLALFLPMVFLWKGDFYPWADASLVAKDPVLQWKSFYLNDTAWTVRFFVFAAVLVFLSWRYQTWTRMEEKTGDESWWKKRQFWGGLALVVYVVVSNFMWTDWLMSQNKHWFSTIYGVWLVVSSCLMAFSIAGIVLGTQYKKEPYRDVVKPWLTKDIGNWMLAFTMLWGYFSLSQYLIIWSGNQPEFIDYFVTRSKNGWEWLGTLLIPFHFFLPFTLLLSPSAKRVPWRLATIGILILSVRFFDVMYTVMPTWKANVFPLNPWGFAFFFLFGAIWCFLFGMQIATKPLLTYRNIALKEISDHA
ncbi:MAG: hypothetical protein JSS66_14425 [Armatimonadetes bacterium]|nr:hypothetical protein [Armatimonadota bacterium]